MRRGSLLAAVVLVLLAQAVRAQSPCPEALAEAQKSYDSGDFAQAVSLLRDGCRGRLSRSVAVQVQSLLARALMYDERPDEARKEISRLFRVEPGFDDDAGSPRFAAMLAEVRREEQTTQVVSVSKTSESLREAPATVVVVTGEEIERRGYLDLEQLLHDLPGFDVNRTNGDIYSHVYQRGYYDEFNSRLLLLVDGVEQNDLTQGTQYLSRQYPLTNIDRVEVVYGPASTMYGANAYTGVISVITKDAAAVVGENKRFGVAGHVTAGGYGSGAVDMTAAGASGGGTVAWSVAGRYQQGKERDLSGFDSWDYTYRNLDYATLPTLQGVNAAGLQLARQLDQALIQEHGLGFDDRAKNWGVNAKLQVSNLTLGLQSWRSEEGVASGYGASEFGGSSTYTPAQTALYLRYSARLAPGTLNVFTRYLQSSIDEKASAFDALAFYANGILTSRDLFPRTCGAAVCPPRAGILVRINGRALSTQIRSEVSMAWQPSETLSGVTGVEFAKSTIQSQYDQFIDGDPRVVSARNYHTDAAVWGQGSWKPRPSLRFIAAGRLSYNQIDNSSKSEITGFGTLFTPRLGVIYTPGRRHLVLKAIYSEAFKDPTDTEKFGGYVFPRVEWASALNFDLRPERVRNAEVSAGWEPDEGTAVQLSAYQADYSGVIAITQLPASNACPAPCLRNKNRDEIRVRGLEATARHRIAAAEIWANYTYAQPAQRIPSAIDPDDTQTVRVPNIAANQVNVGVDAEWRRLTAAIRTHYSGARKIGRGTAFLLHPEYLGDRVDAYSTTALALTYRDLLPNMTMQIALDNIFDKQYWAVGSETLPSVLQNGRTASIRIIYGMK
ncbi:MAG TPA: TonB-dependent receptor [Thermoanaerobaculia bacterium]|nr:TonB-dependent receptor [Thermoanaerobaculia bacterium]